jgi:restriction system protein
MGGNQLQLFTISDLIVPILKGLMAAWPIYALILVIVIFKAAFSIYEKQKLAKSGIDEIDKMDGKTFEKYLEVLFNKLGYRVERTRYIGDYGADLITNKDGVKTVIQAKRFKNKVNIKAVQEAVAAKGKYGCSEAMVVTNSYYTKQAEELARANGVRLWNRKDLANALLSVMKETSIKAEVYAAKENDQDLCVICGKPLSEKVKQFCLINQEKFSGKAYCYEHQKSIR